MLVEHVGEWRKLALAERIEQFHEDVSAAMETGGHGYPPAFSEQYRRLLAEVESILGNEPPVVNLPDSQNVASNHVLSTLRMLSGQLARWYRREAYLVKL